MFVTWVQLLLLYPNISTVCFFSHQLPSSSHQHLTNVAFYSEPRSYNEASLHPDWVTAMNKEIQALEKNSTWCLTDLPPGKKAIGNKWVYKAKLKFDGTLERLKPRLVIQGNHRKYGIDYF